MLSPTYKSRSEDFKKQFKDIPSDERLIVGELLEIIVVYFYYKTWLYLQNVRIKWALI